jgi:hypothetical protein
LLGNIKYIANNSLLGEGQAYFVK